MVLCRAVLVLRETLDIWIFPQASVVNSNRRGFFTDSKRHLSKMVLVSR